MQTAPIGYDGPERPSDEDLNRCTRCGLCEQACPTYRVLGLEADSPRGRIFLMKQVADGESDIDADMAEHLYVCLGCRACETACPSGVPYGRLLEYGRYQVEKRGLITPRRRGWRLLRTAAFEWLLPRRWLTRLALAPAVLLQRWPALRATAQAIAPGRLRDLLRMIPDAPPDAARPAVHAYPDARFRVGLFRGCVMDVLFAHVHTAERRVLTRAGCLVIDPPGQWCCGALNVHAGERDVARGMARRLIDAFEDCAVDFIAVDSAGCGAVLKEYGELLRDDPAYAESAHAFALKVRDVAELLAEIGMPAGTRQVLERVTYQDACHLAHGQRVREQPRALLRSVPGLEFVEMAGADRCCGAAGVYSLTNPVMSKTVLDDKLDALAATGATTVVTGNPGCHMQLRAGIEARGMPVRVRHIVELLDEATGDSS